jgi:hypothetical protein
VTALDAAVFFLAALGAIGVVAFVAVAVVCARFELRARRGRSRLSPLVPAVDTVAGELDAELEQRFRRADRLAEYAPFSLGAGQAAPAESHPEAASTECAAAVVPVPGGTAATVSDAERERFRRHMELFADMVCLPSERER